MAGKKPVGLERDPRTMELYSQGLSDQEIADRMGATANGVAQWRCRHGFTRRRIAEDKPGRGKAPEAPEAALPPAAVLAELEQADFHRARHTLPSAGGPDRDWKWWERWRPVFPEDVTGRRLSEICRF